VKNLADIISNIRTVALFVVLDVQQYVAHCFYIRLLSIPTLVINSVYQITVVHYLFSVWKYINISHGLHIFL